MKPILITFPGFIQWLQSQEKTFFGVTDVTYLCHFKCWSFIIFFLASLHFTKSCSLELQKIQVIIRLCHQLYYLILLQNNLNQPFSYEKMYCEHSRDYYHMKAYMNLSNFYINPFLLVHRFLTETLFLSRWWLVV